MHNYQDTLDWLFHQLPMFSRVGAAAYKPGLDTSLAIDAHFNHPHRAFKSIHIAGTNGKGSVSHNLASILMAAGHKVGLYTSPHLADFRERIRVNGQMIPKEAVVSFIDRYKASNYDGHPSFFELTMMMAFDWFAACDVDYAVIEVGMGGRLDSTNIITPIGCVITNISKDHTQFLGDTLPKIAAEKAGIIKSEIPVVIGEAEGDVRKVFEEKAATVGAPITFAQDLNILGNLSNLADFTDTASNHYSTPLHGDYQRRNLATIFAAVDMLRSLGIEISTEALRKGLAEVCTATGLAGRWMQLQESPTVICDTGHNEAGLSYNTRQLKEMMASRPADATLHIVLGFVADKDIEHILGLFPGSATYYITNAAIPRALPAQQLAEKCTAAGLTVLPDHIFSTVGQAYRAAISQAKAQDIVYVGGSTFIVADLLAYLNPQK